MIGRAALVPAALAALLLAGSPAVAAPHHYTVVIDKMKFGPAPANLRVGDRITWINKDLFRHTATAANGSFDLVLDPGKSGTIVLRKPGTISVTCRYHPGMRAVLKVGD